MSPVAGWRALPPKNDLRAPLTEVMGGLENGQIPWTTARRRGEAYTGRSGSCPAVLQCTFCNLGLTPPPRDAGFDIRLSALPGLASDRTRAARRSAAAAKHSLWSAPPDVADAGPTHLLLQARRRVLRGGFTRGPRDGCRPGARRPAAGRRAARWRAARRRAARHAVRSPARHAARGCWALQSSCRCNN